MPLSHIFVACNPEKGATTGALHRSRQAALALARQFKRKLDAGADFGALARADSDDRSSAQEGRHVPSSLGMFFAPESASAIHRLRVGEVCEPILGSEGYHLIRLDMHFVATFENRHKMIEAILRDEPVASGMSALLQRAPLEFNRRAAEG